ncbi:DUF427 domain-containing protein [Nocardia harenae]|uniref:DUF427 domain-containing protein n=1 Tax=Nocardia harenae TaxID=358707 RepID=UPI00082DAAD7|nr:DUF427 domain-containing protein [Nocardia harenae]
MSLRSEPSPKRVRAYLAGRPVADTATPLLVWEIPYYPAYYLPLADLQAELAPTGATETHDLLGTGTRYDVLLDGVRAPGAALRWSAVPDHVRLEWPAMDEWLEEDEPVYVHPRDPYKRVDVLASSKHVRIELDGTVLAESRSPRILFETSLPPRYYLPFADVRLELLTPSATRTNCPYKGTADYWTVTVDGVEHRDIVWGYRTPLPESQKIAGLLCFYNEKVDIVIDGVRQDRPQSPFS